MLNRLHTIAFFSALVSLLLLAPAEGSTITWTNDVGGFGSLTTGVSDIPTAGSYVDGVYFGTGGNQSVGTDIFHQATYPTAATAQSPSGGISLVYPFSAGTTSPGISPAGYGTVLNVGHYSQDLANAGTAITLSNLAPYEKYQVQLWVSQADGNHYVMSFTSGNSILVKADSNTGTFAGQFALGVFNTSGVGLQTETITINHFSGGGLYDFVNAIAVRNLGVVPEPGSIVLMLLGVTGLCIAARRRAMVK